MEHKLRHENYNIHSFLDPDTTKAYIDTVLGENYETVQVYNDNKNSFTARIKIQNDDTIVIKVPRGRNKRPWQKVLNIVRNSDAFRIQNSLVLLQSLGLYGLEPILAAQQKNLTVKDSFFLYRYQEGREAAESDHSIVAPELLKLHAQGFLRGDCKPSNFVIFENKAYFIDFRLKKPLLFKKTKLLMEYLYLCKSMPRALEHLPPAQKKSVHFTLARFLLGAKIGLRRLKKSIRN